MVNYTPSVNAGLEIWRRRIQRTSEAIDMYFKTERLWAKELSILVAKLAEEFILVHVPWVKPRGMDVLFRSNGDEFVGMDKRWTITRFLRYNRTLGKQTEHWRLHSTANVEAREDNPYFVITRHHMISPGVPGTSHHGTWHYV